MNSKGKGIITAVIVILIRKNIRKHTNNLTMQQENSLSFSQSKRKMFYSTKERLFIRWESMGKP